jgi:archaetidylinositol phosphate synthase
VTISDSMLLGRAAGVGEPGIADDFKSPRRIQTSPLARGERALLNRLCRAMPGWVTSDHLTALAIVGAAICGAGYIASNWSPAFLFLSSLGLAVHWFGDSLDGSLARHRKLERPRYGYFLDHSVDAICFLMLTVGLGFSPYVSMDAALFLLAGYYLVSIYVFLYGQVVGKFRMTFLSVGATEFRLVTICFNLFIFIEGPFRLSFAGASVSLYSLLVGLEGAVFVATFIYAVLRTARKLRREDESLAR